MKKPAPDPRKQAAWSRGRRAERIAALWLRLKGYRLLARGFRCRAGEIDLIVRRGGLLCFVEVKDRPDDSSARYAIGRRQQARIMRAAEAFLQQRPALAGLEQRFDAVLLGPGRLPRHLPDAWRQS